MSEDPDLDLKPAVRLLNYPELQDAHQTKPMLVIYDQLNAQITRKQILPLIQGLGEPKNAKIEINQRDLEILKEFKK